MKISAADVTSLKPLTLARQMYLPTAAEPIVTLSSLS
jgi:hypothetical protein